LVDDQVCQYMSNCIGEGGVADVYVEKHEIVPVREQDAIDEGSGYEEEMEDNSEDDDIYEDLPPLVVRKSESKEIDKQVALVRQFYSSPREAGRASEPNGDEKSDTDSEYMPGDSCSSGDDDEAAQICRKYKDFKKKLKRGEASSLDDVIYEGITSRPQTRQEGEDDGNCTPYADSSDVESVDELVGVGQGNIYPRFNKNKPVVKFKLGMKFSSKKQFKKAAIRHGLEERKVIRFPKDDSKRVRAVCD